MSAWTSTKTSSVDQPQAAQTRSLWLYHRRAQPLNDDQLIQQYGETVPEPIDRSVDGPHPREHVLGVVRPGTLYPPLDDLGVRLDDRQMRHDVMDDALSFLVARWLQWDVLSHDEQNTIRIIR